MKAVREKGEDMVGKETMQPEYAMSCIGGCRTLSQGKSGGCNGYAAGDK